MIISTSFVSVVVNDQDVALEFYTTKLGFEKRSDYSFQGLPRFLTVAPRGQAEPELDVGRDLVGREVEAGDLAGR